MARGPRRRTDDPRRPDRDARREGSVLGQGVGRKRYPTSPIALRCLCGPERSAVGRSGGPPRGRRRHATTSISSSRGGDRDDRPTLQHLLGKRLLPALAMTAAAAGLGGSCSIDRRAVRRQSLSGGDDADTIPDGAVSVHRSSRAAIDRATLRLVDVAVGCRTTATPSSCHRYRFRRTPSVNHLDRCCRWSVCRTADRWPDHQHQVGPCAGRSRRFVDRPDLRRRRHPVTRFDHRRSVTNQRRCAADPAHRGDGGPERQHQRRQRGNCHARRLPAIAASRSSTVWVG